MPALSPDRSLVAHGAMLLSDVVVVRFVGVLLGIRRRDGEFEKLDLIVQTMSSTSMHNPMQSPTRIAAQVAIKLLLR
jgi:hypothetical protein